MSKKMLMAAVGGFVLVCLAVFGVYLAIKSDDSSGPLANADTPSQEDRESGPQQVVFEPKPTNDVPFEAKLNGTRKSDNVSYTMTLEYDGKGNSKASGAAGNDSYEVYKIGNEYISCNSGTCFMLPNNDNAVVQEDQYSYTDGDLQSYREGIVYDGKAECPAGSCEVWKVDNDNLKATFYVADDGKISRVVGTRGETDFEIVYTYKDVTIVRPENVREIQF